MRHRILLILALLCLASPALAVSNCPRSLANLKAALDWGGTGLTLDVFEQWLNALPYPSATSERVSKAAIQELLRTQKAMAGAELYEWEIARAINAGLKERTPHDRIEPFHSEPPVRQSTRMGLGLEVALVDGSIVVERTIEGSSAARNSLKLGDQIEQFGKWVVSVHGAQRVYRELTVREHSENANIRLNVRRGGNLLSFEMKPSIYSLPQNVHTSTIPIENVSVGVMTLREFASPSVESDVARGLDFLCKSQVDGIILDLRGNTGGRVDAVVKIAGYFLGKQKLVIETKPLAPDAQTIPHDTDSLARVHAPILVLVDYGTASAAEILAGVLQHYQMAYIVGTPSFGKGSIQTHDSPEGKAFAGLPVILYTTTSLYYLPNGKTPQRVGLLPDIEMHQPFLTRAHCIVREYALPNSLAAASSPNLVLRPDPLRDWLCAASTHSRVALPNGDFQKEVALSLLLDWIELRSHSE